MKTQLKSSIKKIVRAGYVWLKQYPSLYRITLTFLKVILPKSTKSRLLRVVQFVPEQTTTDQDCLKRKVENPSIIERRIYRKILDQEIAHHYKVLSVKGDK